MLQINKQNQIEFSRENEHITISDYGENIIRVTIKTDKSVPTNNWTVLPSNKCEYSVLEQEDALVLRNEDISAKVEKNGHISFYDKSNVVFLDELWMRERDTEGRLIRTKSGNFFNAEIQFCASKDEHFYGMGQEAHDLFDLKGSVIDLLHQNTKATIPFTVSTKGYGFLWNNPGIGRVEFGGSKTKWVAEETQQVDYFVIKGDRISDIVKLYSSITGYAPEFPQWALGFWQSKLRYTTQDELLEVAREYHKRNIPVAMIVCDYFHWPQQGEWKFDTEFWPSPKEMVEELEKMGMKLLISIWPTVDPRSENFDEMKEQNMLIRTTRGPGVMSFCRGPITYYDTTNPTARDYVWNKVKENYYSLGIKNFWLDEAEPEFLPYDYDNLHYTLGAGREVTNLYPYYYAKTFYDGMVECGETEIVNLIRCAFIGIQKYGVILWSGDICANFDSMRRQLKAGLNVSLCGIPWWTTDIGGFHGGDPDDEEYRECIIRWFQFGAFCPVFRLHGDRYSPTKPNVSCYTLNPECYSGGPNEIWSYGEKAYNIMKNYIFVREDLKPYIAKQMELASLDGTPVMRPLIYDFNDIECLDIYDQYMFGPDLMPCPVHEYNCRERKVYLPLGEQWINASTGEQFEGGQWIDVEAPLEAMPLFIKKGNDYTSLINNYLSL